MFSKEVLISEKGLTFEKIISTEGKEIEQGLFIILSHVDKVPPHISLVQNSAIYSLAYNGKKENYPLKKWWQYSERKKIPSLFIEIQLNNFTENKIEEIVSKTYSNYEKLIVGEISCLSPIKKVFCQLNFLKNDWEISNIFDFLPFLSNQNLIKDFYVNDYVVQKNGSFTIKKYHQKDIDNRILTLQNK